MKKILSILILSVLLISVLSFGMISADSDNGNGRSEDSEDELNDNSLISSLDDSEDLNDNNEVEDESEDDESDDSDENEMEQEIEVEKEGNRTKFKIAQKIKNEQGEYKVKIKGENFDTLSDLNISIGNGSLGEFLRVRLSDGKLVDVNILPDDVSNITLNKMKVKCAKDECTVRLKQEENGSRLVYNFEYSEEYRFLFLFKRKANATIDIDAKNGDILNITARKVVVCHKSDSVDQTITVSKNALKAHLAHGDSIGACTDSNQTVVNPPTNNTNVTIPGNNTNVALPELNESLNNSESNNS